MMYVYHIFLATIFRTLIRVFNFHFYTQSYNSDIDEIGRVNSNNDRMIIKRVNISSANQQHIQLQILFPLECPRQSR